MHGPVHIKYTSKKKWLVYVEYMEDGRPATLIRIDAVLRLHNSVSKEKSFVGRKERQE